MREPARRVITGSPALRIGVDAFHPGANRSSYVCRMFDDSVTAPLLSYRVCKATSIIMFSRVECGVGSSQPALDVSTAAGCAEGTGYRT